MIKPRVLFPFVEAGMGHIMPLKSVADVFEEKYGDRTEVVRTNFYTDQPTKALLRFQKMLVNVVWRQNRIRLYSDFLFASMGMFHSVALKATMKWFMPKSYADAMIRMRDLAPDLVFSTHWATSFYAQKLEQKPLDVIYCPDIRLDVLWRTGADPILMPAPSAVARAREKKFFDGANIQSVPILIRKEAFSVSRDKKENRRLLGIDENLFTVTLANGGYGSGNLGKIVKRLLRADQPMNVVTICGKNEKLYKKLKALPHGKNVRFYPIGFTNDMLRYIAAADLFVGKSGANSMAEPKFFGVPMLITMYATKIERDNGEYYIQEIGCAMKEFRVRRAVDRIVSFARNPELLMPYTQNAQKPVGEFGAEAVADLLFEQLVLKYGANFWKE